jgi:hypothetical protein
MAEINHRMRKARTVVECSIAALLTHEKLIVVLYQATREGARQKEVRIEQDGRDGGMVSCLIYSF